MELCRADCSYTRSNTIIVLSVLDEASGNRVTALRIATHLHRALRFKVKLIDLSSLQHLKSKIKKKS